MDTGCSGLPLSSSARGCAYVWPRFLSSHPCCVLCLLLPHLITEQCTKPTLGYGDRVRQLVTLGSQEEMRAALFKSVQDPGLWRVSHTQACLPFTFREVLSEMYQKRVPMVIVNQGKLTLRLTVRPQAVSC